MKETDTDLSIPSDRILVVDSDDAARYRLLDILQASQFDVTGATDRTAALIAIDEHHFDLVLVAERLTECSGIEFIRSLSEHGWKHTVIIVADDAHSERAIQSIRDGAYDVVSRNYQPAELLLIIRKALERERLTIENELLRGQVNRRYSFSNIIAKSPAMIEIFETIRKIADYRTTVLITGESGTGKELVAKSIHYNSGRKNKRFIALNCGAIPENLLESELFGHRKGAFTDALRDKKGLFEEAEGGTILLDEIGELPLHLQVKILRVLQENEIRPVGDSRLIPIDVRMIAATLRDLENDVLDGRFRDDLFYRLNVITLRIPPLRERKEDIPLLINAFIKKHQEKLGLPVYGVAKDALGRLIDHDWPGNIRELENCIERGMIMTEGELITMASLPRSVLGPARMESDQPAFVDMSESLSIKQHSRTLEETLIRKALERTAGNRTHAARLLEISHRTLLYKLKEYNMVSRDDVSRDDEENTAQDKPLEREDAESL